VRACVRADRWMDGQMDIFREVKNLEIPPISGPLNL